MLVTMELAEPAPQSILDQDLYKFCMQQTVLEHYPDVIVEYGFINRDPSMRFNQAAFTQLQKDIAHMEHTTATNKDIEYLKHTCPYLSAEYLQFLASYRFNPTVDIACSMDEMGALELKIMGKWTQVILYEIPLLSMISSAYFSHVDTDWNYTGQLEKITAKGSQLVDASCEFAEFGTRRRRDFKTQNMVVCALSQLHCGPGQCTGTSNVYLARKYNMKPVGTVGHEWTMAIAALEGTYENGNSLALRKWHATFKGSLGIALTDTFGTTAFFANFDRQLASLYAGVRHDSGDPFQFIERVHAHYTKIGISPATKTIVFSDGLDPEKAIRVKKYCAKYAVNCSFGIGTNFTNDFLCASDPTKQSKAANIVIKLLKCGDKYCVKLSDVTSKHTGDACEVERAQTSLTRLGLLD